MNNWFKAAVVSGALVLIAGTAAATTTSPHPAHPQPANAQPRVAAPLAFADTSTESKYTPIAPCRIVDTRLHGGAIAANATRSFHALGNGSFSAQGGASCGIPRSATAVTGSIIAVGAAGSGYLKVYGYAKPEPTPSFLNFVQSLTLSASGTIPVSNSTYDFTVKVAGHPIQVVVQLTGYFIAPMWVEVASNGSYVHGSRTVSLTHLGTGSYQVNFDRDVSACGYVATSYFFGYSMEVEPRSGDATAVYVGATDYNGTAVDSYFYLVVTC
ncbi:MAG: hypothetical protein ACR2KJ_06025 [Jatrophihabitans sp.]